MPLRIKKAGGFERGTDDKAASVKIALYALRYKDQVKLWQQIDSNIESIKNLIAQRDRIVNAILLLTVPVNELKDCGCAQTAKTLEKLQKASVAALQKSKLSVEALIAKTIQQDEQLNTKIKRVASIKGIGQVTSVALMVYTKGFIAFEKENNWPVIAAQFHLQKASATVYSINQR